MLVYEGCHRLNERSSSAWAKYALAPSAGSGQACAISRWPGAVRGSRVPAPSGDQPFPSAHRHAYRCSPPPSSPTRSVCAPSNRSSRQWKPSLPSERDDPPRDPAPCVPARWRTSGANLFVVLLISAPLTQKLEPPADPARFTPRGGLDPPFGFSGWRLGAALPDTALSSYRRRPSYSSSSSGRAGRSHDILSLPHPDDLAAPSTMVISTAHSAVRRSGVTMRQARVRRTALRA